MALKSQLDKGIKSLLLKSVLTWNFSVYPLQELYACLPVASP